MSEQVTVQVNAIGNFSNLTGEMNKFKSQLQGLKLPKNIMSGIEKAMDNVSEKANKFQSLLAKGINSKGDYSRLVSSAKEYETAISQLDRAMDKVGNKEIKTAVFNSSEIKNAEAQLEKLYKQQKEIANFGSSKGADIINKDSVAEIQKLIGSTAGLKKKFTAVSDAFKTGNIDQAKTAIAALIKHVEQYQSKLNTTKNPERGNNILDWAKKVDQYLDTASADVNKFQASLSQLRADKFKQIESNVNGVSARLKTLISDSKQFVNTQLQMAQSTTQMNEQVGHLRTQANYFFGLQNMGRLVARGIREAAESVRDLDKAMTETAVVTDFSVGDMWDMLPEYTKLANKLGATTQGAYETMTLYFQQGLDKKATFEIGEETMKMARIAGLDYADTTNMMTAALRGFNMELNQTSAKRVNDVYSELAAITASDTRELGLAMERTASIAHSAGMDFGNTTAFLAQMIETTREAPENLGTAMKTIIARFQELKENPYDISEVEGEEVDFNRVDKALKSIGVDLMDNRDKFRDLDDVFMDISSKWDGLSQTQQRYVATIAAGARQQSRFLAMVQNYDRLKQLTDAAANSEGASTVQFNKTLESYEAKVHKLSNAWQEFTMHLANNKAIKGGVDILKQIIEYANKIVQAFGKVGGAFGEMFASFGLGAIGFKALKGGANLGLGALARITKSSKGDQMFGSGGRDYGFANRITQPIVNAINAAAAKITNTERSFGSNYNSSRVGFKDFRTTQQGLRFTRYDNPNLNDTKFTKLKARPIKFNNKDVVSQISKYDEEQQKVLLKQVPGTMSALERSYAEATKKLNLSESATNTVTNLRNTINKEMLRPGSGISPEAGMNILGNPAELSKYIEDDSIRKEFRHSLAKTRLNLMKEANAQGKYGKNARAYVQSKESEIYNPKTTLTAGENWANRFAGITSGATAAGQAVMSLGVALDNMGLHGAGSALTMIGSTLTNIGMAASGTVTAVTSLNTALKGIGLSLGPIGIAIGAFTALGVALGVASAKYKKHIQNIQKDSVKVMKDFDKEMTESTSNINKLLDSRDDYFRLSQGVDRNNNNISLGTEEYADYLQIVNDIAKIQPELVKGYNAHGQAILKNNNAVNEAIQLEQKRQKEAEKTFTSADSLDKLIAGRNSTKRWQVQYDPNAAYTATSKALTKGAGGSLTTSTSSVSKLKQDAQSVVESIQKLKGGDDLLKSMAEQFNIDVTDFTNLTDAGVKAISDHGANMLDQVNSQLSDASDEANQKLIKNVQDGIAQVGKDTQGIEEVTEPIYKSLSTFASRNHLFDNIPDELKDAAELGLKEISKMSVDPATGGKITGAAMQQQAMAQARQLENLNGHKDAYKQILEDVEKAQDDFSKNLSEEDYTAATEDAINKLTVWANQARQSGDAMQIAMAESFEGQIDSIRNFVSEGAALLEDGFNTFADQIEGANSAFETFQKQIESGDFYTGAENMKKIFDEIQDGVDNAGKGSQTFWKGAKELLGEQNKNIAAGDFKATEKQIKDLELMFQEGEDGVEAFFDHVATKQGETLDTTGEKVSELFKVTDEDYDLNLDNLSAEQFTDLANKLGMSDQMLASMLNKAKQFYDIDFSNIDVLRNALYSADSSIKGTETTGGQTNLYTRESTFKAEAEAQGYTPADIKSLIKDVEDNGIKLIPDSNTLTSMSADKFVSTMSGYINDMGIKSTQGFVDTFSQLGFSKEELNALYDKGVEEGLLSENKYDNFDDYYNDTLEKQQENIANTAEEQTADNTAKTAQTAAAILGALGVATGGGAEAKQEILGGKGDDTLAQNFQYGRDKNGNEFKTREEYETNQNKLQSKIDEWKLAKAGIEASIDDTDGAQREALQSELDGYNLAIQKGEEYLAAGKEVWEKREKQLEQESLSYEEYSKGLGAKTTMDELVDPQEAQKRWGLNDEQLSEYQTKYNQIVQMHNEAAAAVSKDIGLNDYQGKLFGESFSTEQLKGLTTFKDTFSQVTEGVQLTDNQIRQLGDSLSGMSVDQLNNLTAADFGTLLSNLKLTDDQIKQLEENNPKIKFEADTTEVDKVTGGTDTTSTTGTTNQTVNIQFTPLIANPNSINTEVNNTIPAQLPAKTTTQPVTIKINPNIENKLIVNTVIAGAVPNTLGTKTTTQPVTIKISPNIEDRSVVNTVIAGAVPNELPTKTVTQPISIVLESSVSNPSEPSSKVPNNQKLPTQTQTQTQNSSVTLNTTIANPNEPKEKIKAAIPKNYSASVNASIQMKSTISTKGLKGQMQSAASNASKGLKVSAGTSAKVTAKTSGQGQVTALNTAIKSIKGKSVSIKANVSGTSKVTSLKNAIDGLHNKTVTVTYKQSGKPHSTGGMVTPSGPIYRARGGIASDPRFKREGTDTIPAMLTPGEYVQNRKAVNYFGVDFMRQINHRNLLGALQSFGSAANGRYGRLGPDGNGGLTLTGEEGFEIAWIPSESRSLILGWNGPEMVDLPKDAIIWTNEESKKIMQGDGIPAGSHAYSAQGSGKRRRKSSSGGSGGSSGGSSKSKSKSKGKSKSKKKGKKKKKSKSKPTINNFSMQEVVRFNIDKKLTELTDEIAKKTKEIEKALAKIGNTYSNILSSTNAQITALQEVKNKNQNLYNSYAKQLAEYRGQKAIVSYTNSKGKSKTKKINVKTYLNADGSVNQAAIQKLGSRALREAVYKEISGNAKPLTDGMNNAKKAMDDAQQQIEEMGQKVSEAFYQWENELTEVYDLTQKINTETALTDRFASQVELELSKLRAGFGDTAESIENIRKVLIRDNKTIEKQIKDQQQMIAARQRELELALSTADELERLERFRNATDVDSATKQANINWAQDKLIAAELGRSYIKNLVKDIDGHIEYEIDWEKFNADKNNDPINSKTYEEIKKYLDDLSSASDEFNKSIKDQTDFIKQTYEKLIEYQDFIVDFEGTLIDGYEEIIESDIDNIKSLSDAISDNLKDLLDEVKRKLDERREREDNLETERDISQKQQRLAALRADTSGGHQVEIAQLEKEIADAQQDYQRTLEDQLLDKLEEQADRAAEQRDRQIELAETLNEINSSTNKELVNLWLKDPEKYKEEIKEAWLKANGFDEKGVAEQYTLLNQFKSDFANLITAIEQTGFINGFDALENNTNTLVDLLTRLTNDSNFGIEDPVSLDNNALLDATKRNTDSILTEIKNQNSVARMKAQGVDASSLKLMGYEAKDLVGEDPNNPIYTVSELKEAGYTAKEVKDAGINDASQFKDAGYEAAELKDIGFTLPNLKDADFSASELKDLFSLKDLIDANFSLTELREAGYKASEFKELGYDIKALKDAGYSPAELKAADYTEYEFGTGEISYNDAKAAGFNLNQLKNVEEYSTQANKEIDKNNKYNAYINKLKSIKSLKPKNVKSSHINELFKLGSAAGYGKASVLKHLVGGTGGKDPFTWENIFKAILNAQGIDRYNLVKTFGSDGSLPDAVKTLKNPNTIKEIRNADKYKKAKKLAYKTGGLADYTGPAWLDGTPSKPELVLNSTDTKNFLALKDVLSHSMDSIGTTSEIYYGDTNIEVNINVDHINNDYDVDKIAERVKKNITKDASYRNVTRVRNLK